ncbi:hypothetical protein ACIBF1_12350 [Spirillospora sp. NPDC050679]
MRGQEAAAFGRTPARVLLRGGPAGWRYEFGYDHGAPERGELPGGGTAWDEGPRGGPEPDWWRRRLAETAGALRERLAWTLTDRTFGELGAETDIAWFEVEGPCVWEGLVTLRDPDPARFPGKVAPLVVTLEPGRGAVLPDAHLLFSTLASDVWTTLEALADAHGSPAPRAGFLCGWDGHRSVRIGRSVLHASTQRGSDGAERLGELHAVRLTAWGGNPELRFRLDGIDLLDEPAGDVLELLDGLGHEIVRRHGVVRVPAMGLALHPAESGRFGAAGLQLPEALAHGWR